MTVERVSLFLALLAVVAEVAVVVVVVVHLAAPWSPLLRRWRESVGEVLSLHGVTLAFCVAAVSMAGSLYFSEVAHFVPCRLCWYQRIAMYPLVPILGLAAWWNDLRIRPYAGLVAALGGGISIYHVLVEHFPSLESGACEVSNPCTIIWVRRLGYLTIPTMALSAFALIVTLMVFSRYPSKERADDAP
jgi:disulfide bond formation protein DsbB